MEKEQALQIIKQICSLHRGTLEEHKLIQEAIKSLEEENDSGKTSDK